MRPRATSRAANEPAGAAAGARRRPDLTVDRVEAAAYAIPTDRPESDGTLAWDRTTLVAVDVRAGGLSGFGYTYTDAAAAALATGILAEAVRGADAFDVPRAWAAMSRAVRNVGRPGLCASAIAGVDAALWDLKARALGVALVDLLGASRDAVDLYGSGGFTSYSTGELQRQLAAWVEMGFSMVKMKVGREPDRDPARVRAARAAIGDGPALFVDANGAWDVPRAVQMAEAFAAEGVSWLEEPVSSDDLDGLRRVRDRAPGGMAIAAGEYGYDAVYFRRMLESGGIDVLQPDATRCGGITGFLQAGALCEAYAIPASSHTAPSLHLAPCCAVGRVRHAEYFHDHVRIEQRFFDGAPQPVGGRLAPDRSRPGLGLELKRADIAPFRVA